MSTIKLNGTNDPSPTRTARSAESSRAAEAASLHGTDGSTSATTTDTISVSGQAARVGQLVDRVKHLPDVRHERVEALRAHLESGSYRPAAEAIAAAIISDETQ